MSKPPLPSATLGSARDLRSRMTDAEQVLWRRLRGGQLEGMKFRRQHPIPPYVVDFYCQACRLVVELDGSQHSPERDAARTTFIESRGLKILRFNSNEVLQYTNTVIEAIWNCISNPTLTPTPLPVGEGLKSEDLT